MPLERVTITGADDATDIKDLLALSREFGFCEWGVLLSAGEMGTPRYPTYEWLLRLYEAVETEAREPHLSMHVCGRFCRDVLAGRWGLPWRLNWLPAVFQRVQFNFVAPADRRTRGLLNIADEWGGDGYGPDAFIVQVNPANRAFFTDLHLGTNEVPFLPLFDASGGRGETPAQWPSAIYTDGEWPLAHGYAGGLGPDNLGAELPRIAAAAAEGPAGDAPFWIDMETRVRTEDGARLDLAKVRRVLEIAAPFVATAGDGKPAADPEGSAATAGRQSGEVR